MDVTVLAVACERPVRKKVLRDRDVDRHTGVAAMEVAYAELDVRPELLGRPSREETDRASGRVPPVECALGAAKHLDAFELDELTLQQTGGGDLPHVVHVGADVRDAAHVDRRAGDASHAAANQYVRHD